MSRTATPMTGRMTSRSESSTALLLEARHAGLSLLRRIGLRVAGDQVLERLARGRVVSLGGEGAAQIEQRVGNLRAVGIVRDQSLLRTRGSLEVAQVEPRVADPILRIRRKGLMRKALDDAVEGGDRTAVIAASISSDAGIIGLADRILLGRRKGARSGRSASRSRCGRRRWF